MLDKEPVRLFSDTDCMVCFHSGHIENCDFYGPLGPHPDGGDFIGICGCDQYVTQEERNKKIVTFNQTLQDGYAEGFIAALSAVRERIESYHDNGYGWDECGWGDEHRAAVLDILKKLESKND